MGRHKVNPEDKMLTAQEEQLALAVIRNAELDPVLAKREAGLSMPDRTANAICRRPHVAKFIRQKVAHALSQQGIASDDILKEMVRCAMRNAQDYMRVDNEGLPHVDLSKMTRAQAAAIDSFEVTEAIEGKGEASHKVRRAKLSFVPKIPALESLAKIHGMFKNDNEQKGGQKVIVITVESEPSPKPVDSQTVKTVMPQIEGEKE